MGVDEESAGPAALIPRSPLRVMQLLEALSLAPHGVNLAKLSQQLGTPKSSLLNLLRALEASGYVQGAGGLYRLSDASLQLGAMLTGGNPFLRAIRPLLRRLAHDTGETALIGVLTRDGRHAMPVESVESRNPLRFAVPIGRPIPLHNSAIGRAILAFKHPDFIESYLDAVAAEVSAPGASTSKANLAEALDAVRRSGIAEIRPERPEGILGFGAPIFDREGRFEAAVALGGPAERTAGRRAELVSLVRQTGAEMSEVLGHPGAYPAGAEPFGALSGAP